MSAEKRPNRKDGTEAGSHAPARGYRWETATPGNFIALKHGATSPRIVDPLAEEIIESIRDQVTWLTPADEPALLAWGRAEAQCQLLTTYLASAAELTEDGVGDLDADRIKAAYLLLHRAETRASTLRTQLGLTPLARAKLGRDVAAGKVDMAKLMADEYERQQRGES